MRALVAVIPLLLTAAPAIAEKPAAESDWQMPAELTDPAMAERLARMMGAMSKAMLDMPIGGFQAAVEGREATDTEKQRTLREIAGKGDPNLERKIEQQTALAVPRMQAGMKALASSMPAMMKALEKAADEMEREADRAAANLPQPGYPKR